VTWFVVGLVLFYAFSTFLNEYVTNHRVAELKKRVDALYENAHSHPDHPVMTKDEVEAMVARHFAALGDSMRRQHG
jgi:hypothetical protein